MVTIGVIGASGQVGTEVCLFLKTYSGVRVIAIVRTPISGAILRRCGIEVRVGNFGTHDENKRLLGDCGVIVDFSAPASGEVKEVCAHYARYVTAALQYSPSGARYVFISTINAFGMGDDFNRAKNYWIAHSVYAYTKRYAEQLALRLGKRHRKDVYVFRLGHVHGLLQRVSQETAAIVSGAYTEFDYPDTPSYTIFCHTIAEAIVNISAGTDAPGIYTLVSEPAWSWKELLEYYAAPGRNLKIRMRAPRRRGWWTRVAVKLRAATFQLGYKYRETLRANLLYRFARLDLNARSNLYRRRAHQQIKEWQDQFIYRAPLVHEGIFPGKRLATVSDSRITMGQKTAEVRRMLESLWSKVDQPIQRVSRCLRQEMPTASDEDNVEHQPTIER